jgi:hypothetical protein
MTNPLRLASVAVLAAALAAGCEKDNPGFCGDDCPIDASRIDAREGCLDNPGLCTEDETCLADVCVDCEAADDHQSAQCAEATPVCTPAHVCRACASDGECDSNLCEGGQCVAADNVIYLAASATDNPMCNAATKCKTLQHAMTLVTATRKHVRMDPGTYLADGPITVDGTIVVVHGNQAVINRGNNGEIFVVTGAANLELQRVTIADASGSGGQNIECNSGSRVTLRSVTLATATQNGIHAANCVLDVRNSTIIDNAKIGIEVSGGQTLTVVNSTVAGNDDGGVHFTGDRFTVVGNYIIQNGDPSSPYGGLDLGASMASNRLEFNTVAGNLSSAVVVPGMRCAAIGLVSRNNIVWENTGMPAVQHMGCAPQFSALQGATVTGTGNVNTDPAFARTGEGIEVYHLMANSPLRGAADPATAIDELTSADLDGTARPTPAGGAADIGADEIP